MMLFIYDFEFNLLLAEKGIISSRWVVYYNDVGTFEAHLPLTSKLAQILSENSYIVVKQHGLSAIIVGYELSDELVIYGRTCNWLFTKRITDSIPNKTVFIGEKATQIAKEAFFDVENLCVKNVVQGDEAQFEAEGDTTLSVLKKCLDKSELGHQLCFNEKDKTWDFYVLSGTEKEIILSEAHKNAYNTGVSFDLLDYASCGRYQKETDNGFESTEIVKDADKQGIYRWEAKLLGETPYEAQKELEDMAQKYELSLDADGILWERDYDLGDTLRVQVIKGALKRNEKRKVVGVELNLKGGRYTQCPMLK